MAATNGLTVDADVVGALPPGRSRAELVAATSAGLAHVPADAIVVVALSGGPDSTALAFLVAEARPDLSLHLVHVRHGLRDDRLDVASARETASFLGAPLSIEDVVVEARGDSLEGAAREQRLAALRRVATRHRTAAILVGHSADDQAETLVLRMARGTGVDGLSGMAIHGDDLTRPLLRIRRADLHRFLELEGLTAAVDPTNADPSHARNRLRMEVMEPLSTLGPDVVGAIARLAELARGDADWLDEATDLVMAQTVREVGPVRSVRVDVLAAQPVAAARRIVRRMVVAARPGWLPPTASEVESVRHLTDGAIDLPEVRATAAAGWLTIAPADLARPASVDLVLDGRTAWPAAGWMIEANSDSGGGASAAQLGLLSAWQPPRARVSDALVAPGADAEWAQVVLGGLGATVPPLQVRPRRPGDRIATAAGTRKLQDVFVDAGVPRLARDLVPVVATADRVLWVPGLAADDAALRTGRAIPQLHLVVRLLRQGS